MMLLNMDVSNKMFSSVTSFFRDTSLAFGQFPGISLTAVKFPGFSRQLVTLYFSIFKEVEETCLLGTQPSVKQ